MWPPSRKTSGAFQRAAGGWGRRGWVMAKRFTDTDKWKRPWFRGLPPKAKVMWLYLLDQCDHAGIWLADFDLMSFQLDTKVAEADLKEWFGNKVFRVDQDKFFIPSFFEFQYADAKEGFKAKQSALRSLEKLGLLDDSGNPIEQLPNPPEESWDTSGLSMDCPSISKSKSTSKSKSNTGGVGGKSEHPLVAIWNQNRGTLPEVRGCTGKRKIAADARWQEKSEETYWADVIHRIARSEFCQGKNDRGWVADFDFLIRPGTDDKILEGKYDNRAGPPGQYVDPKILKLREQAEREEREMLERYGNA